ncbi:hypothetical protein [Streptomyces rimosus]|uniref:hypothetical protein n=1 Tax=Streptomyces rimosus TaxID=1927 RepID=UPI00067B14F7|nr:hypothetical protein [Streptomyces rimosus]
MARYLFGGTTDTAAETGTGARLPNATGTVWNSGAEDAEQLTDLVDFNGNPMSMLTADANGMVPAFYGPDGLRYLWVDFGAGKYMMLPTDTVSRLDEHVQGADPHGDRNYADDLFDRALPMAGARVQSEEGRNWLTVQVPGDGGDGKGSVVRLTDGSTAYTRLLNHGALYIDTVGTHTPLAIGAPLTAAGNFITCHNGRATAFSDGSAFTVKADGSVISTGTVSAKNIGGARVFSGPTPPDNPQVGDVWVQFG